MNDNRSPETRWRAIGHQMADDAQWQRGVELLGLFVHEAVTRNEPQESRAFADDAISRFTHWVTDEAATTGQALTEERADDIAHAFLAAAVDFAETLPFSETGRPS